MRALNIQVGQKAGEILVRKGLHAADVRVVPAASGSAKWLALSRLDRAVFPWLMDCERDGPLHVVGSSIGAWRMASLAQSDPLEAIMRFEEGYIGETWEGADTAQKLTSVSWDFLCKMFDDARVADIMSNPRVRYHVMAVRSRHLMAREEKAILMPLLAMSAGLNIASRKTLGLFFERALFHDGRGRPAFADMDDLPIGHVPITANNLRHAILSTSVIPVLMTGAHDVPDAPPGVYRDGGVVDYHFDIPFLGASGGEGDDLVLYPHFNNTIVPGWFDKKLSWRKPAKENVDRMVMLSPSDEFVAALPYGKIPDRRDFTSMTIPERLAFWDTVLTESERMADEFREIIIKGDIADHIQPITAR